MNVKYSVLYILIVSVICEEHIPRAIDPDSKKIHQKIVEDAKVHIPVNIQDGNLKLSDPRLGDVASDMKSIISEKDVPSSKINNSPTDLKDATGGIGQYIHNPSYITMTMLISSKSIDCYYYKASNSFEVDFQVLKGGDFDIALAIYDADVIRVAHQKSSNDGNIKVIVPPDMIGRDYSLCFDNHDSSRDTKKVFMMIDVVNSHNINTPEYAQLNKLDLMNTALSSIYSSLIQMEHLQEKQRAVESIDRTIMERNFEYVTMWCIIEISLIVTVSAIQLILIRSLFDAKGGIGATIWKKLHSLTGGRF